jgi:undecaprenyl diphosphate synthase
VRHVSAYAFSTGELEALAEEVRFLMGFNRDVIRRRRDEMHELGVRVRWAGPAATAVAQRRHASSRTPRGSPATTTCSR